MIRRGFVTIGARQVHYRTAGAGPPVVLIHQSPTSSRTLELQIRTMAERFTAIALDIPSLGASDPLAVARPEIEDLAEALAETLDALGIARCALYGSHTGALICVAFARRHPERAAVVLSDGYPIYTSDGRAFRSATYFPPFEASWDGGHLLWLWCRYREQYLFWPWNVRDRATRARCDVPDPEFLHQGMVDLLHAGNGYALPYAAVFRHESGETLAATRTPVILLGYADDSLLNSPNLMAGLPPTCRIEPMPEDRHAAALRERELVSEHLAGLATPVLPATAPRSEGISRLYADVPGGQVLVRRGPAHTGRPLLMLPPMPGAATMALPLIRALAAQRHVVAFDYLGCGESDPGTPDIDAAADQALAVLDGLGIARCDVHGWQAGASVALALQARAPDRVGGLVLESALDIEPAEAQRLGARWAEPIAPRWDGTHLVSLWHALRNQQLFFPWWEQTLAARRATDPQIDSDALTVEAAAMLRHHGSYGPAWHAAFTHPTRAALDRLAVPALHAAHPSDPFAAAAAEGAARRGRSFTVLPQAIGDRARIISDWLAAQP